MNAGSSPPHPPASAPFLRPFEIPLFHQTLSEWFNAILDAGFQIERLDRQTQASDEIARAVPAVQDTQVAAYFLHIRCRAPNR